MSYEKLTIRSVKLTKSRKGDNFVVVEGVTDGGTWIKEWIGATAPAFVIERWWKSAELACYNWEDFASPAGFDLVDKEVLVKLSDGDYGKKIDEVRALDYVVAEEKTQEKSAQTQSTMPMKPAEDDIPF